MFGRENTQNNDMPKKGYKHSEEAKRKMSLSAPERTGNKNPFFGKKHSEATKKSIREKNLGRVQSKEEREKRSNSLRGKKRPPFSIEWRKRIGDSVRGKRARGWRGGRENTRMLIRKYRAKKMGAIGSHNLADWENLKAQYNWTCPSCKRREPEIELSEDHIIPLSRGGSNNIENIQPLCRGCNSRKKDKIIPKYAL